MPQGRNAYDRLAELERRLNALEAGEARLPERPEFADEEIIDIGLILLAYVYEGDTERYAERLVKDHGMPSEKAEGIAVVLAHLLEERRKMAENPRISRVGT